MTRCTILAVRGRSIILSAVVLVLAACGSSPTVRYYSLSPMDSEYSEAPPGAQRLGIGPFRLPDYLTRSKIVTRGSGAEVRIDEYHRWLEPVDDA
ncbi:MAG: ABC-type transport auxiliary lipoprotein family protein, partial [Pseudomonadota bacterium]